MKNALIGFALAAAAAAGGNYLGSALCDAVEAPQRRFDVEANAAIERFRRESAERIEREQAQDARKLAPLMAALHTQLTMADYDRLQIGLPAAFAHAVMAPFQATELAEVNGITSYLYCDGPRSIIITVSNGRLAGKLQSGL